MKLASEITFRYPLYIPGIYQVYTASRNIHGIYMVYTDYIVPPTARRGSRWPGRGKLETRHCHGGRLDLNSSRSSNSSIPSSSVGVPSQVTSRLGNCGPPRPGPGTVTGGGRPGSRVRVIRVSAGQEGGCGRAH